MHIYERHLFIVVTWMAIGLSVPVAWLIVDVLQPEYAAMSAQSLSMEPPTLMDRLNDAVGVIEARACVIGLLVGCAAVGAGFGWLHSTDGG